MSRQYQYVKINDRYLCLQQNLAVLVWILFIKKDTLHPIIRSDTKKLSPSLIISWFRNNYRFFKKNLIILIIFARYKHRSKKNNLVVNLPVYGQLCIPTHKGYKTFDLCRGVVAKVFDQDVNPSSISSEIEQLKYVSQIDFAPSLKRWNIEERWYEEDYVSGSLDSSYKPLDSATLLKKFNHDLVSQINSLILFQPSITKKSEEYAKEIIENLEVSRMSRQALPIREFLKIKSFLDSTVERLHVEGSCPVFLVFTHGDFCPANMLNTRQGIKIIDWESAGYRSALFDVYSYFFYRPVSRRIPVHTLVSEINYALPCFIASLGKKAPEISSSLLHLEKVYRWIYYIEEICKGMEREMTDKNLDILEDVLRYIDSFNCYEEILSGEGQTLECVE